MFGSLFGKKKQAAPNPMRETLFGDLPPEQWPPHGAAVDELPWNAFAAAHRHLAAGNRAEAIACWQQILTYPNLESRHYLQAWHFLRQLGQQPPPEVAKQLYGVVVEVDLPTGLDLLAAYADHSARYYNYSGAGVIWEHPDQSLDSNIDELFSAARAVVARIGPSQPPRPAPPPPGHTRISFLTPSGLHFGQGPMPALARDPLGGRVIQLATALMQALIVQSHGG